MDVFFGSGVSGESIMLTSYASGCASPLTSRCAEAKAPPALSGPSGGRVDVKSSSDAKSRCSAAHWPLPASGSSAAKDLPRAPAPTYQIENNIVALFVRDRRLARHLHAGRTTTRDVQAPRWSNPRLTAANHSSTASPCSAMRRSVVAPYPSPVSAIRCISSESVMLRQWCNYNCLMRPLIRHRHATGLGSVRLDQSIHCRHVWSSTRYDKSL